MDKNILDVIAIILILVWMYEVNEPNNWRLLFARIKMGSKKPITVWKCKNDKGIFEHNHFEEGHLFNKFPTPKFPNQKSWLNQEWKYYHAYLTKKNVIVRKINNEKEKSSS